MASIVDKRNQRLTSLERRIDRYRRFDGIAKKLLLVALGLLLIDGLLLGSALVEIPWAIILLSLFSILISRAISRRSATQFIRSALSEAEKFCEVAENETLEPVDDPLRSDFAELAIILKRAEEEASRIGTEKFDRRMAETTVDFQIQWVLRLASEGRTLEIEARSLRDQSHAREAASLIQNAISRYENIQAIVDRHPEVEYDENVAQAVGIEVSDAGLTRLPGVGDGRRRRLEAAGVDSLLEIHRSDPEKLAEVKSIGMTLATKMKDNVRPFLVLEELDNKLNELNSEIHELMSVARQTPSDVRKSHQESRSVGSNQGRFYEPPAQSFDRELDKRPQPDTTTTITNLGECVEMARTGDTSSHLENALDALNALETSDDSRALLIRAHNALCRAIETIELDADEDLRPKVELAISQIETRLSSDESDKAAIDPEGADTGAKSGSKSYSAGSIGGERLDSERTQPTREELLVELRQLSDQHEGVVSRGTMWATGRFSPGDYEAEFGSWDDALEEASLFDDEPGSDFSDDENREKDGRSTDAGSKVIDRPEGRLDELVATVVSFAEGSDCRREYELRVETNDGVELPLTIWSEHDVLTRWRVGRTYTLHEVRHKVWESNGTEQHALSSTRDFSARVVDDDENGSDTPDGSIDPKSSGESSSGEESDIDGFMDDMFEDD